MVTYGRMRHDLDLEVKAVLSAYKLPILRATWALDPEGCKDAVVKHCADDLGLPILGQLDKKPGPARRRGIIWHRHLGQALQYLTFGHMIFERRYEEQPDGYMKLVSLGPRMPWTVATVRTERSGEITEIVQTTQQEPIPASRLAWYVTELEGSNWTGVSPLRAAFGAWLLKHEAWRTHATSIRRFGMGVPTVEAPQGATQLQVQQAQEMASAMRAGDQSGMGLPQGFKASLMGIHGGTPDALAFIRYLDQSIAKSALAGLIELGQTETGSRALGETFLDLFQLAIQAVADDIATIATSGWPGMPGIVTDLVDQNWGEDEPAPRIVCTDVGENYQVTAESVNTLVTCGAVSPDPELDAWLRKTWRMPERATAWEPSSRGLPARTAPAGPVEMPGQKLPELAPSDVLQRLSPGEGKTSPSGVPGTVPAGQKAPAKKAPKALKASAAPRREGEAGFNAIAHQQQWQSALDSLLGSYRAVSAAQRVHLVDQVQAATRPVALDAPPLGDGPEIIFDAMNWAAHMAAQSVLAEAAGQGVMIDAGKVRISTRRLASVASARAQVAASAMAQAASGKALQVMAASAPAGEVAVHLDGMSDQGLREQLGAALTAAQNHGRVAAFQAAPAGVDATYIATEILDANTCGPCQGIDGHEFDDLAAAESAYPAGGYLGCQGLARCRGTVMALWGHPASTTVAAFNPREARDSRGRWTRKGVGALSDVYNEIPETRGPGRGKSAFTGPTGRDLADRAKLGQQAEHVADPITEAEARDESRAVTNDEYQALARTGVNQLGRLRAMRSPITELDRKWPGVKDRAFKEAQASWGGVTIDAHTGEPLDTHADKYALSVKKAGMRTVSVPEGASQAEFSAAMDRALAQFREVLVASQSYLGVFHDDENNRIDIDPVLVVDTPGEVESIGAYTHAIGGAYHFASGNGFYPPHVPGAATAAAGEGPVRWAGPGQWRTEADDVQPGLTEAQDAEIERAAQGGTSARFNPDERRDRMGRWTSGPGGTIPVTLPGRMNVSDEMRKAATAKLAKTTSKRGPLPDYDTSVAAVARELSRAVQDKFALENGKDWYPAERRLNEARSAKYNVPVEVAAAVESATSPRCGYARNQLITEQLLERVPGILDGTTGKELIASKRIGGGILPENIDQAIRILSGSPIESTLTGDKRRAFFSNIVSPGKTDLVTIDAWMEQALSTPLGLTKEQANALSTETGKHFPAGLGRTLIADATRKAAAANGLSPDAMQAVYWIWSKAQAGDKDPSGRGKGGIHSQGVKAAAGEPGDNLDDDHYDAELLLGYLAWRKRNVPGRIDLGPPASAREDDSNAADNDAAWNIAMRDPRWAKLGWDRPFAERVTGRGVRAAKWDPSKHPRIKHGKGGGRFTRKLDTNALYHHPDGSWEPERQAIHDEFIRNVVAGHQPQDHPVAVFLGGGAAAGKSSVDAGAADSARPDADKAKMLLPEAQAGLAAHDKSWSGVVHNESSWMADYAVDAAREQQLNLVVEGIGDTSYDSQAAKAKKLRDAGYAVSAKYVTADLMVAQARAVQRGKDTGRYIPASIVRSGHQGVAWMFPELLERGLFDSMELWDTTLGTQDVPRADLILRAKGRQHEILDQAAYDRFLAQGRASLGTIAAAEAGRPVSAEDAAMIMRGLLLGESFPPEGVADTPASRSLLAELKADIAALPEGATPEIPFEIPGGTA